MRQCLPEPALWPAVDGDRLSAEVEIHLESCARCSAQVVELRENRRQFSADASIEPSSDCSQRGEVRHACSDSSGFNYSGDEQGPSPRLESDQIECPASIGGYPIERLLRLGGQAEVFVARHPTLGHDDVVVKWAYGTISADSSVADQFTEEAQLLAALKHRNLPRVYDLGIAADRPFLVLEQIAGVSLAELQNLPLLPAAAALLIAKVARALDAVHRYGRLHLDIQPDNILLGNDGEPRLIDFGMSLSRSANAESRRVAVMQGTPEYMAPEQLAGDAEQIGIATDLYALGAVLHQLTCGAPPQPEIVWSGVTPLLAVQVPPYESPNLRRLQAILRRALDPDPQRRYGSALEFARDLEHFAARRRPVVTAMLAGAIVLAVGLVAPVRHIWPANNGTMPSACEIVGTEHRTKRIADALVCLLREPDAGHRSASIILADGRCVPFAAARGETSESAREFADRVAHDLSSQPGTTLLLFGDNTVASFGAPYGACHRRRIADLPAGTIAHVTDSNISVLAHACSDASALAAALQRVQSDLRQQNSRFSALVVMTAPVTGRSDRRQSIADPVAGVRSAP